MNLQLRCVGTHPALPNLRPGYDVTVAVSPEGHLQLVMDAHPSALWNVLAAMRDGALVSEHAAIDVAELVAGLTRLEAPRLRQAG